jgi:hypothetical protein
VVNYVSEKFLKIFDSLSRNQSIEELKVACMDYDRLKLRFPLDFIEKNTTLKSLDLSNVEKFSGSEKMLLNDALMKNNSLNELNLSFSDFQGPFEFLKKKNLKKFTFLGIWESSKQKSYKDKSLWVGIEIS